MYCIVVKTRLKPGSGEGFLQAMLPNAQASVRLEPGCHVFDVLKADEEGDTYYLYEIYSDKDALDEHKKTPHYRDCRSRITALIAEQTVIRAGVVALNPGR